MMIHLHQTTKYFTSYCLFVCFMFLVRSTTASVDLGETSVNIQQQEGNDEIERKLTVHGKYFDKGTMVNPNSPSNYNKYSSNYNSSSSRSNYNNNYNSSNNNNNRNSNTSYNNNNNSNSNNRNSNTSSYNNKNTNSNTNYNSNNNSSYNKNTSTTSNNNSKYNTKTSSSSSNSNSYWNSSKRNLAYGGVFLTAAVVGSFFGRRRMILLRSSNLEEEQESQEAIGHQYDEECGNSSSTVEFVSMDSIISQSSLNGSQDESTTTGTSSDNSWI